MGEGHAACDTYGIFTRANISSLPAHSSLFKLHLPSYVCGVVVVMPFTTQKSHEPLESVLNDI